MIYFLPFLLILVTCVAQASELTDAVIKSRDLTDLSNRLSSTSSDLKSPEGVPRQLLDIILNGQGSDEEWKALQHYSVIDDAGASLEFCRSNFNALKRNPTLFYSRFMNGDPSALERMADAFCYDYSAYQPKTPANNKAHQAILKNALNQIASMRGSLSGDAIKKHNQFMEYSFRQFERWKKRKKGSDLQRRGKRVRPS
jgi:hypothetical protein